MRVRLKWSSIVSTALFAIACSSPKPDGLFKPASTEGDSGAGAGAANGESTAATGAEDSHCGSGGGASSGAATAGAGGVAGAGASSGAATAGAGGVAGNGGAGTTTTIGACGGAAGSIAGVSHGGASDNVASANNGGAGGAAAAANNGGAAGRGGGGNATGGTLGKCELLLLQANAQLQGAQTCSTASGEAFCTGYATNECGCKVPVNKGESIATENYVKARDTFKSECSATCTTPCVEPKSQTCQLIFGLVVGSCVAM